jgi:hypothetical protein
VVLLHLGADVLRDQVDRHEVVAALGGIGCACGGWGWEVKVGRGGASKCGGGGVGEEEAREEAGRE